MEEPCQFSVGRTAHSLTCSILENPHTWLDDCLRMLQACFSKRMSEGVRERGEGRKHSWIPLILWYYGGLDNKLVRHVAGFMNIFNISFQQSLKERCFHGDVINDIPVCSYKGSPATAICNVWRAIISYTSEGQFIREPYIYNTDVEENSWTREHTTQF